MEGGNCSLVGWPCWEAGDREEERSIPPVETVEEEDSNLAGSCGIAVRDTPFLR